MGLFGNNKIKKLRKKHMSLLQEAFELSKVDRSKSDEKYAEAHALEEEIISLESNS